MRFKFPLFVVAALALSVSPLAMSQVVPTATTNASFPLSIGAGVTEFNRSYGNGDGGFSLGDKVWIDFGDLHGLGVEVEAEQVGVHPAAQDTDGVREEVASGGVTYSRYDFHRFHPFAKFLLGYGNVDYPAVVPTHQTRTVYTLGGGANYPLFAGLSARVEYEYQLWPNFWLRPPAYTTGKYLTPNGVAFGISYSFNRLHD